MTAHSKCRQKSQRSGQLHSPKCVWLIFEDHLSEINPYSIATKIEWGQIHFEVALDKNRVCLSCSPYGFTNSHNLNTANIKPPNYQFFCHFFTKFSQFYQFEMKANFLFLQNSQVFSQFWTYKKFVLLSKLRKFVEKMIGCLVVWCHKHDLNYKFGICGTISGSNFMILEFLNLYYSENCKQFSCGYGNRNVISWIFWPHCVLSTGHYLFCRGGGLYRLTKWVKEDWLNRVLGMWCPGHEPR